MFGKSKQTFFPGSKKTNPEDAKKISVVVYTRIENDTGGDQALLFMITEALKNSLLNYADSAHLYLAHDELSLERASNIANSWRNIGGFFSCGLHEPTRNRAKNSAALNKLFFTDKGGFQDIKKPINLLIIAGWSHRQISTAAKYLKQDIKIPLDTKILLCSPPGGYIDARGFKTALLNIYTNVYCLQPSLKGPAGFPIPALLLPDGSLNLERSDWIKYLEEQYNVLGEPLDIKALDNNFNENNLDKFIVIYCSKDPPGQTGSEFVINTRQEILNANGDLTESLKKYTALLIGSDNNNVDQWMNLLEGQDEGDDMNIKTVALSRTENTQTLMAGLRHAEFSIVTGSFSFLEAKYFGIERCKYLAPNHLSDFSEHLKDADAQAFFNAFNRGREALHELSDLTGGEYSANILHHSSAQSGP